MLAHLNALISYCRQVHLGTLLSLGLLQCLAKDCLPAPEFNLVYLQVDVDLHVQSKLNTNQFTGHCATDFVIYAVLCLKIYWY